MTQIDTIAARLAETDPALAEFRRMLADWREREAIWSVKDKNRRAKAVRILSERGMTEQADIVQNCQRRPNRRKCGTVWINQQIQNRLAYIREVAWAWTQI